MRKDVRIKKYTDIYNKVNDSYNNDYLSIIKSCEKLDITARFYYKICKELGKESVASKDFIKQSGGNKNKYKVNNNDNKKSSKNDLLKGTFEQRLAKIQNVGKE